MSDPRGFVYGLEPLRHMQAWRRDAEQVRLARAQGALDRALVDLAELRRLRDRAASLVGGGAAERIDPARHGAGLAYLGGLIDQIARRESEVLQLKAARDAVRAACLEKQRACDATEHHRKDACADHVAEQQTAAMREADSDWLMRAGGRRGAADPNVEER